METPTRSHVKSTPSTSKKDIAPKEVETPSLPRREIPKKELKLEQPVNNQEYSFFDKLIEETKANNLSSSKVSNEKITNNNPKKESNSDVTKEDLFMDLKKASETKVTSNHEEKTVSSSSTNANKNIDAIPIIQNNKLVPEKVDEEIVKQEEIDKRFKEDSKPLEDFSVEDIIFPEMPM